MWNPTSSDNVTNIEKLTKDVDNIGQLVHNLKNDVNKSDEDKKKEAEKWIKEAKDKKEEVEDEKNRLKKLKEAEMETKLKEAEIETELKKAETLSDSLNNYINLYQSIINKWENSQADKSSNQPEKIWDVQTKNESKIDKTKNWIWEQRNKTKSWIWEQWDKVKENPWIVGAGVAVGIAIKSARDWIFWKKKKKNNWENGNNQEVQPEESKTDATKNPLRQLIMSLIERLREKKNS